MRITIPREREREIAPAGSHEAVCYCCVDLGTQTTPYGVRRQLYVAWELPHELNSKGKPFLVGQFYNLTGDARGRLRQDLESWFGRVFEPSELDGLDLLDELIGRTGTIGLVHQAGQNGQLRAQVTSIMLPRRGTPERELPTTTPLAFGLEDGLDRDAYGDLPEWLRGIIAKSPEYQQAIAPTLARGSTDGRLKVHLGGAGQRAAAPSGTVDDDIDDAIPFISNDLAAEPIPVLRKRTVL
jgi:hypothetical protein